MSAVNIGLTMKPRHALWAVRGQRKHDSPSGARASSANARKQVEIFLQRSKTRIQAWFERGGLPPFCSKCEVGGLWRIAMREA